MPVVEPTEAFGGMKIETYDKGVTADPDVDLTFA